MGKEWFTAEDKVVEALLKLSLAQHLRGWLDPCDAGSAYDCTILVPQRFELKHDRLAAKTGNLYFEIRNTYQQQPSGLAATHADFWGHHLPHLRCLAVYRPQQMLRFLYTQLGQATPGYRLTRPDGGDNNSQGILGPIEAILTQPFVDQWSFAVEVPHAVTALSGVQGRCRTCGRLKPIEGMQMGYCTTCTPSKESIA